MKVIFPDTKKMHLEFLRNYGDEFLRINSLNVGDEVDIEFEYEVIKSRYKSREIDKFTFEKPALGVLKLDENNCLYAESLDSMQFYEYTKIGRSYYYKPIHKKSIKKFGTGFIF